MRTHIPTTPFGRRPLTLAQVAANADANALASDKVAHKWKVFRDICAARNLLGISERPLAVLDALLSFHPETALTGEGLVVFPSNNQLCLRAHGMAETTLRRHLAALVDCGLILRRDSPNGKRYARKGRAGAIEKAFGFDISPLVARADEFAGMAERVREEERALRHVKERISLCRRDIIKMIAVGLEEGVATRREATGPQDWQAVHALFRAMIDRIPRSAGRLDLEPIADELAMLADELTKLLEDHVNSQNNNGNAGHNERHKQNSNHLSPIESEPRFPEDEARKAPAPDTKTQRAASAFPLGMVLDACPDLIDYARDGISNWRDFLATVAVVRPMLGISPSAWEDALDSMGERQAAIVVAAILQRSSSINSAGGYLRDLTRRAGEGEFTAGPMIMALMSVGRKRAKAQA